MKAIPGKSVQPGIAVGPIRLYRRGESHPDKLSGLTPHEEWGRFQDAKLQAEDQLRQIQSDSRDRLGEELAAIFQVQSAMLDDPDFLQSIRENISRGTSAEYAAVAAGEEFASALIATQDSYMGARAADARDLARRVAGILSGLPQTAQPPIGILVAEDLSPSEAVGLDTGTLLGLVSRVGSANSHAAILARAMGIPSLTDVEIDPSWDGTVAVLDGDAGVLYLEPDEETMTDALLRQWQALQQRRNLLMKSHGPCLTRDGHEISLCANILRPWEAQSSREQGCRGIGLMRSEFLYLSRRTCPTEEEQFEAYKQTVLAMAGMKVVIRTMDVGADKQAPCLEMPQEVNPALGLRGIRYSLAHPELLRQQLRSILRAAAFGPVCVMFPLVTQVQELQEVKAILDQCRQELERGGIAYGPLEVGTMIETPAAVMIADELAQEVDFFSLGTNDLLQYTMAADRQHPQLERYCDPRHPALLRMIRHTVQAGHRHGCWVGLCGELAADLEMTETLLRLGLDELSVSPSALLSLREKISTITLGDTM